MRLLRLRCLAGLSTALIGLVAYATLGVTAANASVLITVTEGTNDFGVDGVTFSYSGSFNQENAESTSRFFFRAPRFAVDPQAGLFDNSVAPTLTLRHFEDGSFLEDAGFDGFGSGPGQAGFLNSDPSLSGGGAFRLFLLNDHQVNFGNGDIQTIDIIHIGIPGFLEFGEPNTPFTGFLTLPDETLASLGLAAGSFGFTLSSGESVTFEIAGGEMDPSPVPLPAAAWLFGGVLGGLGVFRRARKRMV